jgi:hypothetical protein
MLRKVRRSINSPEINLPVTAADQTAACVFTPAESDCLANKNWRTLAATKFFE